MPLGNKHWRRRLYDYNPRQDRRRATRPAPSQIVISRTISEAHSLKPQGRERMMRVTKTLLLTILLTGVSLSAGARDYHFWDGDELLQRCRGLERAERGERARNPNEVAAGSMEYGSCVGFVVGTVDTMSGLGAVWEVAGTPFPLCVCRTLRLTKRSRSFGATPRPILKICIYPQPILSV